jgi:hypothetical protein
MSKIISSLVKICLEFLGQLTILSDLRVLVEGLFEF